MLKMQEVRSKHASNDLKMNMDLSMVYPNMESPKPKPSNPWPGTPKQPPQNLIIINQGQNPSLAQGEASCSDEFSITNLVLGGYDLLSLGLGFVEGIKTTVNLWSLFGWQGVAWFQRWDETTMELGFGCYGLIMVFWVLVAMSWV